MRSSSNTLGTKKVITERKIAKDFKPSNPLGQTQRLQNALTVQVTCAECSCSQFKTALQIFCQRIQRNPPAALDSRRRRAPKDPVDRQVSEHVVRVELGPCRREVLELA